MESVYEQVWRLFLWALAITSVATVFGCSVTVFMSYLANSTKSDEELMMREDDDR